MNSEKEAAKDAPESPLTPTIMEQYQLISLALPSSSWALEAQGRFGGGLWWETHFGVKVRITDQMHGAYLSLSQLQEASHNEASLIGTESPWQIPVL